MGSATRVDTLGGARPLACVVVAAVVLALAAGVVRPPVVDVPIPTVGGSVVVGTTLVPMVAATAPVLAVSGTTSVPAFDAAPLLADPWRPLVVTVDDSGVMGRVAAASIAAHRFAATVGLLTAGMLLAALALALARTAGMRRFGRWREPLHRALLAEVLLPARRGPPVTV